MSKKKLKMVSSGVGDAGEGTFYVTLYFNRRLNSLEQEGVIAVIKERVERGE